MATFETWEAAVARAKEKVTDRTWITAFAQRGIKGALGVRVQRRDGTWADLFDDEAV
jgi:hypothetical protein